MVDPGASESVLDVVVPDDPDPFPHAAAPIMRDARAATITSAPDLGRTLLVETLVLTVAPSSIGCRTVSPLAGDRVDVHDEKGAGVTRTGHG
jgi:hypothetical protein